MNILLGITGSIAACKAAEIISNLSKNNHTVKVILTKQGSKFITPLTCQALSGNQVFVNFESANTPNQMDHINLARWCDLLLIAPASANLIAQLANGMANDLLSTMFLATSAPTWIAPAMNSIMWQHPTVQNNIAKLSKLGVNCLGPEIGILACKENGPGRMMEPAKIIKQLPLAQTDKLLINKKVLITAGKTKEYLDPIRYLGNNSTGKMGISLVQSLLDQGAEVTCILGPCNLDLPKNAKYIKVTSAEEMHQATINHLTNQDWFIGCAAVADYQADKIASNKIKKTTNEIQLTLTKTKDILKTVANHPKRPNLVIGFAAESTDLLTQAKEKLIKKNCDIIIANLISNTTGMATNTNQATLLTKQKTIHLAMMDKQSLANKIVDAILLTQKNNVVI